MLELSKHTPITAAQHSQLYPFAAGAMTRTSAPLICHQHALALLWARFCDCHCGSAATCHQLPLVTIALASVFTYLCRQPHAPISRSWHSFLPFLPAEISSVPRCPDPPFRASVRPVNKVSYVPLRRLTATGPDALKVRQHDSSLSGRFCALINEQRHFFAVFYLFLSLFGCGVQLARAGQSAPTNCMSCSRTFPLTSPAKTPMRCTQSRLPRSF